MHRCAVTCIMGSAVQILIHWMCFTTDKTDSSLLLPRLQNLHVFSMEIAKRRWSSKLFCSWQMATKENLSYDFPSLKNCLKCIKFSVTKIPEICCYRNVGSPQLFRTLSHLVRYSDPESNHNLMLQAMSQKNSVLFENKVNTNF